MKYDIETYLRENLPSLIELIGDKDISWTKINRLLYNHVRENHEKVIQVQGEINIDATFFTILKNRFEGKMISDAMFDFYNLTFSRLNEILTIKEKDLIRSTIRSIMTEMSRNYINFIGELAVLYIFKASNKFDLLGVEEPINNKNGTSIDFLFQEKSSNEQILIEVLNLHMEIQDFQTIEHLEYWLTSKYNKKKEQKCTDKDRPIYIQPVIWTKKENQLRDLEQLYCNKGFSIDFINEPFSYASYLIKGQKYEHRFELVSTILKD